MTATEARPQDSFTADYFASRDKNKPVLNASLSALLRRYVRAASSRPRTGHFGCGAGYLASRCAEWSRSIGYDISHFAAIQTARKQIPAVCATLEQACLAPGSVDGATAIDVLEHLPDPRSGLRALSEMLRTGAVCIVSVPNLGGWSRGVAHERWSGYRDSTHRALVEPQIWRRWFENTRFQVERAGTDAPWGFLPFGRWLVRPQRVATLLVCNALTGLRVDLPWSGGDNFIAVLRKI